MKCPRCNQTGAIIRTKMSTGIMKETFYCSRCFYEMSLEEEEKEEKNYDFLQVIYGMRKDLEECKDKNDVMNRFQQVLDNFLKGEENANTNT